MISSAMRGIRRGFVLLATGTVMTGAAGAYAQNRANLPPGAVVQPLAPDEGAELRRDLTTLADNPQSLSALVGAGRAALDMGDPQAALAFFGRADQLSPRDARVKAGMASALVRLEQGQAALPLFAQAVALGAPEVEIAGDRGLAYDTIGDTRHAQHDYALVLRQRDDPEIRRRLALSLAISGQKDAALRIIDPQLRANDRAAWRVQAFVLALTGDAAGANRTAQGVMPAGTAQAMAPFFARLPSLSPAEKARAVHFGDFPANAGTAHAANTAAPADPGALAFAQGRAAPPRSTPATRTASAEPQTRASRRRSSGDQRRRSGSDGRSRRSAQVNEQIRRTERGVVAQVEHRPADEPARAQVAQATPAPPPSTRFAPPAQQQRALPARQQRSASAAAGFSAPTENAPERPAASEPAFADVAALVNALPREPAPQATPASTTPRRSPFTPPPPRPVPTSREPTRTASAASTHASAPANPSRHWVQIAGGADRSALPREFARLRGLAPDQLRNRTAYVTPLRFTNRLLVGPFDSESEAQEFVNALASHDVQSFAWTSAAGQEIERLQTSR